MSLAAGTCSSFERILLVATSKTDGGETNCSMWISCLLVCTTFIAGQATPWKAHVDVDWDGPALVEQTRTVATVEVWDSAMDFR